MAEGQRIQRQQAPAAAAARKALQRKLAQHGTAPTGRRSHSELLRIQRTQGNEAVERLLRARRAERAATVEDKGKRAGLDVEVADTPEQRREGLRSRIELPRDHGLLYLKEQARGHTMAGTEIRLSIAYLDRWGKVLELQDGEPGQGSLAPPTYEYQHALEVQRGWFAEHGLAEGSRVRLDGAPTERPDEKTEERGSGSRARPSGGSAIRNSREEDREEEEGELPGTVADR